MLFGIIDSNQPFLFSPHLGGISVFKKKEEIINGSQFFTFVHKKNISFYSSLTKNETGFISISYGSFVEKAEKCKLLGEDLSCSDAELFLRGYLSWGEDCVHHLKGNYVFAIWNSKEEKLFIARSPISHWILYYAELPNGGFVFSTAMQALVEWGGVKKTLDKQHVAHFLTLMIRSEPLSTFFDNIKKLPTGTSLTYKKNSPLSIKTFWQVKDLKSRPLESKNYFEEFQQLYRTVVKEKVNEPFCCQLSGGLDSSSVTCMAASILSEHNRELVALSHIPSEGHIKIPKKNFNYSDWKYIEAVVNHWKNIKLHPILDTAEKLFENNHLWYPWMPQPFLNPCNLLWGNLCIKEAAHLGLRRILSGQMGNFTISWFGPTLKPLSWKNLRRFLGDKKHELLKWKSGKRIKRPWGYFSGISDHLVEELNFLSLFKNYNISENTQNTEDFRENTLLGNNLDFVFSYCTALEFLQGIHLDDPTGDIRVVEFCLRCPDEVFKNEKQNRLLVRKAMDELMPKLVRERTTKGMQSADWYKKVEKQKNEIEGYLHKWHKSPMENYLNISELLHSFKKWNVEKIAKSQGFFYQCYEIQYRVKLLRSIEVGLFIEPYI